MRNRQIGFACSGEGIPETVVFIRERRRLFPGVSACHGVERSLIRDDCAIRITGIQQRSSPVARVDLRFLVIGSQQRLTTFIGRLEFAQPRRYLAFTHEPQAEIRTRRPPM